MMTEQEKFMKAALRLAKKSAEEGKLVEESVDDERAVYLPKLLKVERETAELLIDLIVNGMMPSVVLLL